MCVVRIKIRTMGGPACLTKGQGEGEGEGQVRMRVRVRVEVGVRVEAGVGVEVRDGSSTHHEWTGVLDEGH